MQTSSLSAKSHSQKSHSKQAFKCLLLTASLSSIIGCQSMQTGHNTEPSTSGPNLDAAPISANTAYRQQLNKQTESYQQLFAEGASQDEKAKTALLDAISQHFSHNHVAVSQTWMHETPFFAPDSVDANSQNAFITFVEGTLSGVRPFDISSLLEAKDKYASNNKDDYYEAVEKAKIEIEKNKNTGLNSESTNDINNAENGVEAVADSNTDDEYSGNELDFFGPAYRTEESYLADPTALYLNYIDEKQGTLPTPNYAITRKQGLAADSHDNSTTIIDYIDDNIFECVFDYSMSLDVVFVTGNSTNKPDDAMIAAAQTEYQACMDRVKDQEPEMMALANVYQRQAINRENGCVSRYNKQLSDYIASDRSKDEDFDIYNSIWNSYAICDLSVFNLIDLDPVVYTSAYYSWPQYFLDYKQEMVQCADQMISKQQQADQAGITYNNNPQHYMDIKHAFEQCKDQAVATKIQYEKDNNLWLLKEEDSEDDYYDYSYDGEEYKKRQLAELEEAIEMMKISPAQVAANNFYYYQYLTLNQLSEYDAQHKTYNSVYAIDYTSPSSYTSIQLPLGIDFKQGKMRLDPRALMPLVALTAPDSAPLPEEMLTTMVSFGLPEDISRLFSTEAVYDALISALSYSLTELDSSNFTNIDIGDDAFAKSIGARSAIKVNLDAYQSGKMLGVIVKHMINTLKAHVEAHPEAYEDADDVAYRLESLQTLGAKYLTDDVGRALQALETVLPVNFNKINHFYLDANNQLIGKQVSTAIGSDLVGRTHTSITQTRYEMKSFNQNSLQPLFKQTFATTNDIQPIDGNAWLQQHKDRKALLAEAEQARSNYGRYNRETGRYEAYEDIEDDDGDAESLESESLESGVTHIDTDKDDDYKPVIRIVDYGIVGTETLKRESDGEENEGQMY